MNIDSLRNVENRIAEIEGKINNLVGQQAPQVSATPAGFHTTLTRALGSTTATPTDYDSIIEEAAGKYGIDAGLIKAVMLSESGGRPGAVSGAGAQGLMQLMPSTARSLGVTDPFDAEQNIFGGARYLKGLLERTGSTELAVAAYNAGPGAVQKYGGIPPYAETQNYVATVMSKWRTGGER